MNRVPEPPPAPNSTSDLFCKRAFPH